MENHIGHWEIGIAERVVPPDRPNCGLPVNFVLAIHASGSALSVSNFFEVTQKAPLAVPERIIHRS